MKLTEVDNSIQNSAAKETLNSRQYFSLRKVFFIAFGIILILSMSMVIIPYVKIIGFQSLLANTTLQSMPKVMTYAKVYSQVNELTYATGTLTGVNTQRQRRIAYDALQTKILKLPELVKELSNKRDSLIQLNVIKQEISGLNALIKKRLETQQQLDKHQQKIYDIYEQVNKLPATKFSQTAFSVIIITEQALGLTKLNHIKKNANSVNMLIDDLLTLGTSNKLETELITSLKYLILGEEGILALRVQQLKIFGRTRGRASFVRNLVIDYARLAEYDSFRYNKRIIDETNQFSEVAEKQIKLLGMVAIIVIFTILLITFFMQNKLINRLVLLNNSIRQRLAGQPYILKISGHDEITDIAHSFNLFNQTIEEQQEELIRTSVTDSLTKIPNRRGLDKTFDHLLLVAQRQKWPVAVLMMDVDNFKTYNDFYGHVAGDECLQKIAKVLKTTLRRPEDYVARYGGEEFVCLLPNTDLSGAELVAQSIIDSLNEMAIAHEKSDVSNYITLSIGISISNENATRDSLLKLADNALYRAKEAGKNRFIS